MADGKWRITRLTANTMGDVTRVVEEIRVWHDNETDAPTPGWHVADHALVLTWPDGKEDHYPWPSILKAEYTPPTQDTP